jgi:hypothetical protein
MNSQLLAVVCSVCLGLGLASCGGGGVKTEKSDALVQPSTTNSANIPVTVAPAPKAVREMTFDRLNKYIPLEVLGFKAKEAVNGESGGLGKSEARYFSFASQVYHKNDQSIRIEIVDYFMDANQYKGLLNMYGFNSDIDDNVLQTSRINLGVPGTKAITSVYKIDNAARLIIGAGERFLVIITSVHTRDLGLLRKVAGELELEKLMKESNTPV